MKKKMVIEGIGLAATLVGMAATYITGLVNEKKMEEKIEEKVNEALARSEDGES